MKKKFPDGERRALHLPLSLWTAIEEAAKADNREWYDYLTIMLKKRFPSSGSTATSDKGSSRDDKKPKAPSRRTPDKEGFERIVEKHTQG